MWPDPTATMSAVLCSSFPAHGRILRVRGSAVYRDQLRWNPLRNLRRSATRTWSAPPRHNFIGGDPHDGPMPLDYYVWADPRRRPHVRARHRLRCRHGRGARAAAGAPVEEGLRAVGVDPSRQSGRDHQPHALRPRRQSLTCSRNARYHLQDEEMAYCTGRAMCHGALRAAYEAADVQAMVGKLFAGSRGVSRRRRPNWRPGLTLHRVGGHTRGLQVVRVHTRARLGGAGLGRRALLCQLAAAPALSHRRRRAVPIWRPSGTIEALADSPRSTSFPGTTRWCSSAIHWQTRASKHRATGSAAAPCQLTRSPDRRTIDPGGFVGEQIAFIGVGRMGSGMVGRLLAAGHTVTVFDPNTAALAPLVQRGARAADSAAAAAAARAHRDDQPARTGHRQAPTAATVAHDSGRRSLRGSFDLRSRRGTGRREASSARRASPPSMRRCPAA